jgi:hypothetical protein
MDLEEHGLLIPEEALYSGDRGADGGSCSGGGDREQSTSSPATSDKK